MTTTKTLRIPFGELPVGVRTTVPFRWLEPAVDGIKRLYPDEGEQKTCMVDVTIHGCTIEHTLTPSEQVVDLRAQLEAAIATIRELRDRLDAQTDIGIAGTPAPAAPAAAPSEGTVAATPNRRQGFVDWVTRSGWRLPDDMTPLWFGVTQQGATHAEAEVWLGLAPGVFEAHALKNGLVLQ